MRSVGDGCPMADGLLQQITFGSLQNLERITSGAISKVFFVPYGGTLSPQRPIALQRH